jgi:hypothetical protein
MRSAEGTPASASDAVEGEVPARLGRKSVSPGTGGPRRANSMSYRYATASGCLGEGETARSGQKYRRLSNAVIHPPAGVRRLATVPWQVRLPPYTPLAKATCEAPTVCGLLRADGY